MIIVVVMGFRNVAIKGKNFCEAKKLRDSTAEDGR